MNQSILMPQHLSKECAQLMAEYRLTPAAENDLEVIWAYTVKRWGTVQAERYIDLLTATFDKLSESPKTAQTCDHIRPGYRCISQERHKIYFRITDNGIVVVRVLHERMDAPRHL